MKKKYKNSLEELTHHFCFVPNPEAADEAGCFAATFFSNRMLAKGRPLDVLAGMDRFRDNGYSPPYAGNGVSFCSIGNVQYFFN